MIEVIRRIVGFVPSLISLITAFFTVLSVNTELFETDKINQINRIEALEQAYENGEILPVDEASFFDGNLEEELKAGMKLNEVSFLATHNSYQAPAFDVTKKLFSSLSGITFGIYDGKKADFWSETPTDQLNCGIRSLEIDIETFDRDGEVSFTCMHSPYFEMSTYCSDFALGMKEIAMWSDNNLGHLPVTIIIEPKSAFLPMKNMKSFSVDYAVELDKLLRETLGEKLFTPADMLRGYESFGEMRAADDWCKISDMQGKILVLLHEGNVTEGYIARDPSIKSQAMFPMLREEDIDRDCTSFILCNDPETLIEIREEIDEKKVIARTRADNFDSVSEKCREQAFESKAQIISTDYPPRTDSTAESYIVSFGKLTTMRKR
ncbi:MAG: hypothetical protein E7516_03280 [Ruminococcaceae bacterium]|nr:hypothetical protein [Oscillospiraceae bacterium]